MTCKEDPMDNFPAAGIKSTPAEKVEHVDTEEPLKNSPAAGREEEEEESVEMPEDYLRWLLGQTPKTDPVPTLSDYNTQDPEKLKRLQEQIHVAQAMQDEFFEFQASVLDKLEKDGRVMIPAAAVSPRARDQLQEEIDEFWYGLLKEYDDADSKTGVTQA